MLRNIVKMCKIWFEKPWSMRKASFLSIKSQELSHKSMNLKNLDKTSMAWDWYRLCRAK